MTTRDDLDLSGARWRKSSRSNNIGGNCVESASVTGFRAVRDSKNCSGPVLVFGTESFAVFVSALSTGRLRED